MFTKTPTIGLRDNTRMSSICHKTEQSIDYRETMKLKQFSIT